VTTTTSNEPHVYRSQVSAGSTRIAAAVATILAAVGAVAMIVGTGSALGFFSMDSARTAVLIGLGLVAIGAGALLLVVLQTWRVFTHE
jgi:hypothetical protein